ncbi:MAG: DNRLRE domain-containing protein [bacterium]
MLVATGCNTLPIGEDGLGRIPATDSIRLSADSSAGIAGYAVLGDADTMFLGGNSQYLSRVLIKFTLPDSALDSLVRAQLVLHPVDSARMAFVCHPCSVDWRANAATWRVADSATQWLNPGGDYFAVELCRDTLNGDSLVIEIGLDLMPKLIRESYGIILLPLDTGFARLSSGFTLATAPRFRLYWGKEQAAKNTQTINAIEDAHIVDTVGINVSPGYQGIGSGFAFRTWLRFDLDSIPPEATIARAELRFTPAVEYARGDTAPIAVRRLLDPFRRHGRSPSYANAPSGRLQYAVKPESAVVAAIDVSRLVQYWTAHPDSNFGLLLVAEPEWSDFFRLRVPNSGPAAPQLRVLYALPPTGRLW